MRKFQACYPERSAAGCLLSKAWVSRQEMALSRMCAQLQYFCIRSHKTTQYTPTSFQQENELKNTSPFQ